jgi:hypothetical protein
MSYEDAQRVFTGSLKTMNTEALDAAQVEILRASQRTVEILGDEDSEFNDFTLDGADDNGSVGKIKKGSSKVVGHWRKGRPAGRLYRLGCGYKFIRT